MKVTEINKPIKEYRNVVTPRDEAHYRELMKTLQDLELKSARDPATMAEIKRRRMELRNWAEQNLKREDKEEIGNYATLKSTGQDVRIVDFDENDNTYQISYGEGKGEDWVDGKDLEFIDPTVHQDLGQVGEGMIGKKMEYNDFLQNKLDTAMQEYDTPEKQQARAELMKKYLAKGGSVEKVPAGQKAFVGKKLKPAFKKDKNGTPITSPGSDESVGENDKDKPTDKEIRQAKGIAFDKRYKGGNYTGASNTIDKLKKGLSDHPDVADALRRANEGAPFDGKGILQRAVFNKWISAEEWFHLKDEWQDAARELEQRYSDWPDGEGFGSSDHNFAIRDLMSIVGYEFDDQDTSGKFVVTKMPEKLEKLGITNVRMRGEPVKAEADGLQPVSYTHLTLPTKA